MQRNFSTPFFAFVQLRVVANGQGTSAWGKDADVHQRIVDLIREGEAELTEHYLLVQASYSPLEMETIWPARHHDARRAVEGQLDQSGDGRLRTDLAKHSGPRGSSLARTS
jgi:hypothetical protein